MKTKKIFSIITILVFLLTIMPVLSVGAKPAPKVDVCHRTGNGSFHLINVSENAVPAHLAHGDALPGDPVPAIDGKKFDEACNIVDAGPTVTQGYSGLTEESSVRFRQNNTGGEVYLGKADLGVGANRVETNCVWSDGTYAVTFSYDGSGTISATTNANCNSATLNYSITPSCGPWNTMDILVVDRNSTTGVSFENVYLDGNALGNFGTFDVPGTPGFQNWTVADYDFSQPWTISGDLRIQNFTGSAEQNKLQLTVGCLP